MFSAAELLRVKSNVSSTNSRCRTRGIPGTFTWQEWVALCELHNNTCVECGSTERMTIDHIVPLWRDGPNTIDNVRPLCSRCNSRKCAMPKMIHDKKVLTGAHFSVIQIARFDAVCHGRGLKRSD